MYQRPFYNNDPAFNLLRGVINETQQFAKQHNIVLYLIDRMDVTQWESEGCRPCVTNSIVLLQTPKPELIVNTRTSFYGIYYYPYVLDVLLPKKEFNCFMNRFDVFRQSWLYQLIRRKIFNQGYVSFNMDTTHVPWYKDVDVNEIFEKTFQDHCSIFKEEHMWIKPQIPYRNFHSSGDLTDVIVDSKFSIVLETYFDNNDIQTYSEKIFRALQLPRPWLLFAHKGAVAHLKTMGFDVLDDIVNHSHYDDELIDVNRQSKLLDVAVELINSNVNYNRAKEAAAHNQQLLKKFNQTWKQDYIDRVLYASTLR